jgi:hypothetical protein
MLRAVLPCGTSQEAVQPEPLRRMEGSKASFGGVAKAIQTLGARKRSSVKSCSDEREPARFKVLLQQ